MEDFAELLSTLVQLLITIFESKHGAAIISIALGLALLAYILSGKAFVAWSSFRKIRNQKLDEYFDLLDKDLPPSERAFIREQLYRAIFKRETGINAGSRHREMLFDIMERYNDHVTWKDLSLVYDQIEVNATGKVSVLLSLESRVLHTVGLMATLTPMWLFFIAFWHAFFSQPESSSLFSFVFLVVTLIVSFFTGRMLRGFVPRVAKQLNKTFEIERPWPMPFTPNNDDPTTPMAEITSERMEA